MKTNKRLAGVLAGALAATGLGVMAAPSASADTVSPAPNTQQLYCFVDGISSTPSSWPATGTVTKTIVVNSAGTGFDAGESASVNFQFTATPRNGPFPVSQTNQVFYEVTTTSGTSIGAGAVSAAYPVAANVAGPAQSITDSIPLTAGGATSIRVQRVEFAGTVTSGPATGTTATSVCNAQPGVDNDGDGLFTSPGDLTPANSPIATATVADFAVNGPSVSISSVTGQAVTTAARGGDTINVALSSFPGSGALELCNAAGTTCDPAASTHNGTSGSIVVPASFAAGASTVKATSGTATALANITILGAPSITVSPASGGAGTVINVTGSNFNPNGAATLYACPGTALFCNPAPAPAGNVVATGSASVNASGALSGTITAATGGDKIQAAQGAGPTAPAAFATFSFNALECTVPAPADGTTSCNTQQNISATVTGGVLKQTAAGGSVALGSVATGLSAGTLTGAINAVDVTDTRGGSLGWTLTGSLTDFTAAGGKVIAKNNLSIAPACVETNALSATGEAAGPGGNFGSTQTLCTKDTTADSPGGTSGGEYEVTGGLTLNVPAFQAAGDYSATLTITLA